MNRNSFALIAAAVLIALPSLAQQPRPRLSPHETVDMVIDSNRVSIVYGRPYTKHPRTGEVRKIWGGLVPYGKVWRMGANEATLLKTEKALVIGGTEIPAGQYSLFLLPEETGETKLIVNKQTGQWGTRYDAQQDLASIPMKKEPLKTPADQFTIALEKNPSGGGLLKLMWENTQFSVPFTVKP